MREYVAGVQLGVIRAGGVATLVVPDEAVQKPRDAVRRTIRHQSLGTDFEHAQLERQSQPLIELLDVQPDLILVGELSQCRRHAVTPGTIVRNTLPKYSWPRSAEGVASFSTICVG